MQPTRPPGSAAAAARSAMILTQREPPSASSSRAVVSILPSPSRCARQVAVCTRGRSSACSRSVQRRPTIAAAGWPVATSDSRLTNTSRPCASLSQISAGTLSASARKRCSLARRSASARIACVTSRSISATTPPLPSEEPGTGDRLSDTSIVMPPRVRRFIVTACTLSPASARCRYCRNSSRDSAGSSAASGLFSVSASL